MASRTEGRMIKKDISDSKGFATISPQAAVLFCMIIPHLNSHGKLNGGPGFIKDEVCPRISYLTYQNITKYLQEITDNTSVKWFEFEGRQYIHATKFLTDHQKLPADKLGKDSLPSFSRVNQELVGHEVEVEVKEEVEVEVEDSCSEPQVASEPPFASIILNDKSFYGVFQHEIDKWTELFPNVNVQQEVREMVAWSEANPTKRKTTKGIMRFIVSWLSKEQDKGGRTGVAGGRTKSFREKTNEEAGEAFMKGDYFG